MAKKNETDDGQKRVTLEPDLYAYFAEAARSDKRGAISREVNKFVRSAIAAGHQPGKLPPPPKQD